MIAKNIKLEDENGCHVPPTPVMDLFSVLVVIDKMLSKHGLEIYVTRAQYNQIIHFKIVPTYDPQDLAEDEERLEILEVVDERERDTGAESAAIHKESEDAS